MAPSASDRTDVGLASKWGVSGALGFGTLSGSQPAARTSAAIRPATPGIRLLMLIALISSEVQVAGLEVDFHEAGERPEVRIGESVPPERERVTGQAGDLRIVPGVVREGEQVAPDHPHPQAVDPETEPLYLAPGEGVADVQLLDLDVRPVLDEEVDGIDAVVESRVITGRLFPRAVRAVRGVRRAYAIRRRFRRLIVNAVYEAGAKRPLPRPVVDVAALHPIQQRVGGEVLPPHGGREAGVEVGVHVADLDDLAPRGAHIGDEPLTEGVVRAIRHYVPVFVPGVVGGGIGQARARASRQFYCRIIAQLGEAPHDLGSVQHTKRLTLRYPEILGHIVAAPITPGPHKEGRYVELGDELPRAVRGHVDAPGQVRLVREHHA